MSRKRFFKRYSNRKIRHSAQSFRKGNKSHRIFDYKWEID